MSSRLSAAKKARGAANFTAYLEDGSKFWEVNVDDDKLVVRFGKIGALGQSRTKK